MIRVAVAIAVALQLWQCSSENKPTETATADDCPDAITAFTSNIQPHITAESCLTPGCHDSAGNSGGLTLKAGNTSATSNRARLLAKVKHEEWLGAGDLWKYLNSDDHGGKTQLGGLDKTKVDAWVAAERACE